MNGNSGNGSVCHCHFHERPLVVTRGDETEAITRLNNNGMPAGEIDSSQFDNYIDGFNLDEMGTIVETIALLDVDDPHASADFLVSTGIQASPVHGLGYMGHLGFKGDDFEEEEQGLVHPLVANSAGEAVIAVVDSGLAPPEDLPAWMGEGAGVHCDRLKDSEDLLFKYPVSHGTFVVSVIRRLAPDFVVSIASARPRPPSVLVTDEDPHHPWPSTPTDELNVFGALVRLINRHSTDTVVALNLALGAHDCPGGGEVLMTMRKALDQWKASFPEAVIFAAGGNGTCPEPVYPAAWEDVRAVGAGEDRGGPVVWEESSPVPDPGRDWITDWAPGQKIQGLSGQSPDHLVKWSGSSFACAVATACHANGQSHSPTMGSDGRAWWRDEPLNYNNIPDLVFQ